MCLRRPTDCVSAATLQAAACAPNIEHTYSSSEILMYIYIVSYVALSLLPMLCLLQSDGGHVLMLIVHIYEEL
jgi:hypothetical protein